MTVFLRESSSSMITVVWSFIHCALDINIQTDRVCSFTVAQFYNRKTSKKFSFRVSDLSIFSIANVVKKNKQALCCILKMSNVWWTS